MRVARLAVHVEGGRLAPHGRVREAQACRARVLSLVGAGRPSTRSRRRCWSRSGSHWPSLSLCLGHARLGVVVFGLGRACTGRRCPGFRRRSTRRRRWRYRCVRAARYVVSRLLPPPRGAIVAGIVSVVVVARVGRARDHGMLVFDVELSRRRADVELVVELGLVGFAVLRRVRDVDGARVVAGGCSFLSWRSDARRCPRGR